MIDLRTASRAMTEHAFPSDPSLDLTSSPKTPYSLYETFSDGAKLEFLARLLGRGSVDSFSAEIESTMKQVRRMFLEITERIANI